jgi:hypothetical protein
MTRSRLFLALLLMMSLIAAPSFAAVKAGAKCTKAGATATASGKKFTCVKSGKKLLWNKGVTIKAAPKPDLNPVFKPVEPTPTPQATSTSTPTPIPTPTTGIDYVNYKGVMVYGVRDSKLIRRADTGIFYESDSRKESDFSAIRVKAFAEVNKKLGSRNHPNIEFVYDIRPSFPPALIDWVKRELDEDAALWNDFFKEKFTVNVFLGSEKDREYIKKNNWLNRNMPSCFDRWESGRERRFICAGAGFWQENPTSKWMGNLYLGFPSDVDLNNINFEWPMGPHHEFFHIVQDYAFYRNLMDRPREFHELVQPIHFREGAATTVAFLSAFRNLGWSSDALDWWFWQLTRDSQSWRTIRTEADAVSLMKAMECLNTCAIPTADDPRKAFSWAYGYGAIMNEWVIGTYGLDGLMKMLDQLVTAKDFNDVTKGAFGLSKEDFYAKIAPYILEQVVRTKPYN